MKRMHAGWIAPLAMTLGVAWAAPGISQEAGKRVGEKLDEVGREIKGGLSKMGNAAREQFNRTRSSVHNMSVESRVYGRIHWDKALTDAVIELSATSDGVITLDGTVADARAKARAADLARETVGVTRVVDQLAVRSPTSSTP